ncbi:MAG TPA: P-type conjugative transfer protein TrbJ [Azospirillaceae bacterium]|nr:P-type conjugative transfer protein TrbJ [Azospirillaceae bacterium]
MTAKPCRNAVALLLLAASLAVPHGPAAALTVYDPANHAENVLQAARALEQINHQILALQNQAVMLQNMAKNLQNLDFSSLGQINTAMARINGLMSQAEGIAFTVEGTQTALQQQFPGQPPADRTLSQTVTDAEERWRSAMNAFRQTMTTQAAVVENVRADSLTLSDLVVASQNAVGSLQAQQAANQLIALTAKQQLQIQSLMAAQYRAEALEQARKAQGQAAAKAATERFLGTGKAYTAK